MLRIEYLEYRLRKTATGKGIITMARQHRGEIEVLYKTYKHIMTTWHRHHGPSFMSEGLKTEEDQDFKFVKEIKGVTLESLIMTMVGLFLDYGSPSLRRDISIYTPKVLSWTTQYSNLNNLLEHFQLENNKSDQ